MQLVHERDGDRSTLATRVDVADSFLAHARGLMFRRSIPDDYALAFRFGKSKERDLHMVFVPFDIDAVWTVGDRVTHVKRLSAWTGRGKAEADAIYELPAGAADGVKPGDVVDLTG